MELSSFGRDILRVLDEAPRPLSFEEITAALRKKKGDSVVVGQVRSCLEQTLTEHVKQSSGKWEIAPSSDGSFATTKQPASTADNAEATPHEIPEDGVEKEEIGGLVLKVLTNATSPLSAERIAEHICAEVQFPSETGLSATQVKQELQSTLSSCVERDDNLRWRISTEPRSEIGGLDDEQDSGAPDIGNRSPLHSHFARTHDNTYRGPEDLDESKFLSALYSVDPSVQGYVAAEIERSGNPVEPALDRFDPELAQKHAEQIEAGNPGAKPEKVIDLVREEAGEIEGPIEDVFGAEKASAEEAGSEEAGAGTDSKAEQAEDQEAGATTGSARSTETLSFLQKDILGVLDEEPGVLSVDEVAEVLGKRRKRDVSSSEILDHLDNELSEFVTREPPAWTIRPSHSGKYSAAGVDTPDGERPQDGSEQEEERREQKDDFDQLSAKIFQILYGPDSPLKAKKIAESIHDEPESTLFSRVNQTRKAINQRLYGELSPFVEKNDDHQWRIKVQPRGIRRPVEEESGFSDISGGKIVDQGSEGGSAEGAGRTPDGLSRKINDRLKLADRITFILDLLPSPLTSEELASVLTLRGIEATQEGVERCLESTLSHFVKESENGYSLREEGQKEHVSKRGNSSRKQKSDRQRQEPVDQATRASVSGRRYSYVFEKEALETGSLFVSQIKGGTVKIKFNSSHPGFERVQHIVDDKGMVDEKMEAEHGTSVEQYRKTFCLLIVAWIEMERDLAGQRSEMGKELRNDWGRAMRSLLQ
jgi:predicted Zn-ribbon and HTH transcriptional regulator